MNDNIDWNKELTITTSINNLIDLKRDYFKLQSNWNSLRQWVQKHYDEYKDMEQDAMFEFSLILDKMNELDKRKENN